MDSSEEYPIICIYAICLFDTENTDICIIYFNMPDFFFFLKDTKKESLIPGPPSPAIPLSSLEDSKLKPHTPDKPN